MNLKLIDIFRMEFQFSWNKETWFLPLDAALQGLHETDVSWQPPGGGNTIRQIVNHLNFYNNLLIQQLIDTSPKEASSFNNASFGDIGETADSKWKALMAVNSFEEIGESKDWKMILSETSLTCEKLGDTLSGFDNSSLTDEHVGLLSRQILHNVYHVGQIVYIRKLQGSWPKERQ
ncbi:DinB family protein [Fictibacillus nanhaiensis]|uniref:DinB family protein n=1 Tax=Fictibacillus nanhaiensis TaxID=742169 RepID=UPI002E1F2B27|nr:DinB family protein [Fictibacillus nanhaiensis]